MYDVHSVYTEYLYYLLFFTDGIYKLHLLFCFLLLLKIQFTSKRFLQSTESGLLPCYVVH